MDPISHIAFVYILAMRNIDTWFILGAVALDIDKIFTCMHARAVDCSNHSDLAKAI